MTFLNDGGSSEVLGDKEASELIDGIDGIVSDAHDSASSQEACSDCDLRHTLTIYIVLILIFYSMYRIQNAYPSQQEMSE